MYVFMKNSMLYKHAAGVGVFFILLYVLCLLWRYTMVDPAVIQFHLLALKAAFPGFAGYAAGSIVWGGVLSFVYGFILSAVFHAMHMKCGCMKK